MSPSATSVSWSSWCDWISGRLPPPEWARRAGARPKDRVALSNPSGNANGERTSPSPFILVVRGISLDVEWPFGISFLLVSVCPSWLLTVERIRFFIFLFLFFPSLKENGRFMTIQKNERLHVLDSEYELAGCVRSCVFQHARAQTQT